MDLSVIVPVYNVERYLENCIESIFDQDLDVTQFEVLLINDGSTDSSYSICQRLAKKHPNIRLFSHENVGLSATRNRGIDQAQGKYIYFIDSDDFLKSHFLNQFLTIALQEDLCFIGFSHQQTPNRYSPSEMETLLFEQEGDGINYMAETNFYNAVWWYILKKETIGETRFIEGRLCEDGVFTAEVLQAVKRLKTYKNKVYGYFSNEDSIVRTKNNPRLKKMMDDMFYIALAFNSVVDKLPKQHSNYNKAFRRLRHRQESYLFFAFVRLLRLQPTRQEVDHYYRLIEESKYPIYPIKAFDGYNARQNKLLIRIINYKPLFLALNTFNKILPIIK